MIMEGKYLQPTSLDEALEMAVEQKTEYRFIAGGTDVVVNRFQGNESEPCLIDISSIEALKGVELIEGFLRIGALERLDGICKNNEIRSAFPVLIEAAHAVGSPLIRKMGTIGGNILCENRCLYYNQSEWWRDSIGLCLKCDGDICIATKGKNACFSELVSDTAPALISLNAKLELVNSEGVQYEKLEDIYTGDGVNPRNIGNNTILKSILLPLNKGYKCVFKKLRQRQSLEFTSLTTCVSIDKDGNLKIAMSGVDPKAVVVEGRSKDDKNLLIKQAVKGARAVDNDMYSRKYRREMISVFLNQSFDELSI